MLLMQPSAPIRIFHHQEYEEYALEVSCLDLTALLDPNSRVLWRTHLVWTVTVHFPKQEAVIFVTNEIAYDSI